MDHILFVEPDRKTRREFMKSAYERGYQILEASNGSEALQQVGSKQAKAVVLEVELPDVPGIEVCRQIRQIDPRGLIIFVSSNSTDQVVAAALGAGGSDYLVKPLSGVQLITRIEAHFCRSRLRSFRSEEFFQAGDLWVDIAGRRALRNRRDVQLTPAEFDILAILIDQVGEVVSRERIMNLAWGYQYKIDTRVIDVHIRNLRRKIEIESSHPEFIFSVPGIGYYFNNSGCAVKSGRNSESGPRTNSLCQSSG